MLYIDNLDFLNREAVEKWAAPRKGLHDLRITIYTGQFPSRSNGRQQNVAAIGTGSYHHFLQAMPRVVARTYEAADTADPGFLHGETVAESPEDANCSVAEARARRRRLSQGTLDDTLGLAFERSGQAPFVDAGTMLTRAGEPIHWLLGGPLLLPRTFFDPTLRPRVEQTLIGLVEAAADRGADRIVLGAYAKVNGFDRVLRDAGILSIATGNRTTVVVQAAHVRWLCRMYGWDAAKTPVAIVGAKGSLGRGLALELQEFPLLLVGMTPHGPFLDRWRQVIRSPRGPAYRILVGEEATNQALQEAKIIILATTKGTVIRDDQPPPGIHIADIARPHATPIKWLAHARNLIEEGRRVPFDDGGLARMRRGIHLEHSYTGLGPDLSLPCLIEGSTLAALGFHGHFGIEPAGLDEMTIGQLADYADRVAAELMIAKLALDVADVDLGPRQYHHLRLDAYEPWER